MDVVGERTPTWSSTPSHSGPRQVAHTVAPLTGARWGACTLFTAGHLQYPWPPPPRCQWYSSLQLWQPKVSPDMAMWPSETRYHWWRATSFASMVQLQLNNAQWVVSPFLESHGFYSVPPCLCDKCQSVCKAWAEDTWKQDSQMHEASHPDSTPNCPRLLGFPLPCSCHPHPAPVSLTWQRKLRSSDRVFHFHLT